MRRRQFITLLGGAAATWPIASRGQQAGMPVIGFLHSGTAAPYANRVAAFHQGLSGAGFVEGKTVLVEYRWAEGRYDRLPVFASDLVRRAVDVIVAGGGIVTAPAAKAATATIPIVFITGADPVAQGLVASLARPGGNVTGVSFLTQELGPKRLSLLNELAPTGSNVAVLVNARDADAVTAANALEEAAHTVGRHLHILVARNADEIDRAFETLRGDQADALIVQSDPYFTSRAAQIALLAVLHRIPAIFPSREYAEAGGIMSYGSDVRDEYRQAGVYTARILKGEKPSDLPVLQPTKFELVINLRTAKELGLTVPSTLLARADEVIE